MGSIRKRSETGTLYFDFTVGRKRCREQTSLPDTPKNRRRCLAVLARIEEDIAIGAFNYRQYFPHSRKAVQFDPDPAPQESGLPTFAEYAPAWYDLKRVECRSSYSNKLEGTIRHHLIPRFGERRIDCITLDDVSSYRRDLVDRGNRAGQAGRRLSADRINHIIGILSQILDSAAARWPFENPARKVKRLNIPRTDINPFSLEEVETLLAAVRPDFHSYYSVRFFTGMRPAEIDGLQWKYVDLARGLILIRETWVNGDIDYTKNDPSQRDIQISSRVRLALEAQRKVTGNGKFVFCTSTGQPYSHRNITQRVWYPILRRLGLALRTPYQTRHTAATLWLAAGENPEWIARQLGHSSTEMLFRRYSRFVPNLTRQDGTAFEAMLTMKQRGIDK